MKIPSVNIFSFDKSNIQLKDNKSLNYAQIRTQNTQSQINNHYYMSGVTFGIANSSKLKKLFALGLPCMYRGIEMIDPTKVQRAIKSGAFNKTIPEVFETFKPFEKSLIDLENRTYQILKDKDKENELSGKTLKEALQYISPIHEKRLKKKQLPILHKIFSLTKNVPDAYKYKLKRLEIITLDKLENKPVFEEFSATEFKYKIKKIGEDLQINSNNEHSPEYLKIYEIAKKLDLDEHQTSNNEKLAKIIEIKSILQTSKFKDNEALNKLLSEAEDRLNNKKVIIPFKRKAFLYDLHKILDTIPNFEKQKDEIITIANKLPSSRDNISAYIINFSTEPSEKIAYRLLWPSTATVEHIKPRSKGGKDLMSNFGGACARENSERKSIPLDVQQRKRVHTKENCQRYLDRLVEYYNNGIFKKYNIDKKYIYDFAETVQKESNGAIILNINLPKCRYTPKVHNKHKKFKT